MGLRYGPDSYGRQQWGILGNGLNCPGSILVYDLEPHSYRDLPLRYGELGLVHRHELSGALHGMFRVRCFTQDDAHILLAKEQIKDEVASASKARTTSCRTAT